MPKRAPGGCEPGIGSQVKCPGHLLTGGGGGDEQARADLRHEPSPPVARILPRFHQKTQTPFYWSIAQRDLAPVKLLLITSYVTKQGDVDFCLTAQ